MTGRRIDGVDQPQRQFDILRFFLRGMRRFLHVEIGEDAQQGRADIDAVSAGQVEQAIKWGNTRRTST